MVWGGIRSPCRTSHVRTRHEVSRWGSALASDHRARLRATRGNRDDSSPTLHGFLQTSEVSERTYQTRPFACNDLEGGERPLRIVVVDNQIEPALKALKREMLKDGVFKEMKRRAFYEKPSVKRKRKRAEARRKRLKAARRARPAPE